MELFKTTNIGKFFFWLSFILGNICLFGYFITKNEEFAIAGYLLLIYGTVINAVVFAGLAITAIFSRNGSEIFHSALIMLLNIPIAALYAFIGLYADRMFLF